MKRGSWMHRLALLGALAAIGSCGARTARPDPDPGEGSTRHKAVNPLVQDEQGEADGMRLEGELGTLDEEQAQAGLAGSLQALSACFSKQVLREPYLGGELTLHYRVARDGSVKHVRVARSSLGSLAVERCVAARAAKAHFARPRGGEAELDYPLRFQGRAPAQSWDPGMVSKELQGHVEDLLAGADGKALTAPAGLVLTFYVNTRGKVVSAGMTADDGVPDDFADQLAENLKRLSFVAAAGYAKVTYTW
jgi:hypothetical protein